jgi:hypothetical protein
MKLLQIGLISALWGAVFMLTSRSYRKDHLCLVFRQALDDFR